MPPLPEKPIEKCIAGPGLISSLIVSKTGDHLPIYRSEDILVRQGLHISRSTQCDWPQRRSPVSRTDIPDQHTAGIPPLAVAFGGRGLGWICRTLTNDTQIDLHHV